MYRFWESMLFWTGNYQGAPIPKHAVLPVEQEHFERWLALSVETIESCGPNDENPRSSASIARTNPINPIHQRVSGVVLGVPLGDPALNSKRSRRRSLT
jgi:hemoglobin